MCDDHRFLACSLPCLERHHAHQHSGTRSSHDFVLEQQVAVNRNREGAWERYQPHRDRISRMLCAVARGDGLCVLGAGNGDDLDSVSLAREFGRIHLVDLDRDALARAVQRFSGSVQKRLVVHAGIDLSGFADRIDEFGERLPDDPSLDNEARSAAHAIVEKIGGTFDVVLSACVLSQLAVPFKRTLSLPIDQWVRLIAAMTVVHLETMAGLLHPGGTGVLLVDQISRDEGTETDPHLMAALVVRDARLGRLFETPRITEPWTWQLSQNEMLVHALLLRRVDP